MAARHTRTRRRVGPPTESGPAPCPLLVFPLFGSQSAISSEITRPNVTRGVPVRSGGCHGGTPDRAHSGHKRGPIAETRRRRGRRRVVGAEGRWRVVFSLIPRRPTAAALAAASCHGSAGAGGVSFERGRRRPTGRRRFGRERAAHPGGGPMPGGGMPGGGILPRGHAQGRE